MADRTVDDWLNLANTGGGGQLAEEEAIIKDYTGSLDLGVISIPAFLTSLGPYLNHDEDMTNVARVLELLSRIFGSIQVEPSRHDIHALVEYMCSRLDNKDEIPNYRAGIREVAACLNAITHWVRFQPADATIIASSMFRVGASSLFTSQPALTRCALYYLVGRLFEKHSKALFRDMSVSQLVEGLVNMSEVEKNPSCLRVIFLLYESISRDWDLRAEDCSKVWDSYFRYFPVSMRTPPPDPSVPTSEELRALLLRCFVSSDVYAEKTFKALIDRLDENTDLTANVKMEVLKTIEFCVKSYSIPTLLQSSSNFWDALKFEIWNGENNDFVQASLDILRAISSALSVSIWDRSDNSNPLALFVINASSECSKRIQDNKQLYLVLSGRILNAIASGSPYAFYLVVRSVLPSLNTLWQALDKSSEKKLILTVFNDILRARLAQADVVPLHPADSVLVSPEMKEYFAKSIEEMIEGFNTFRDRLVYVYHEDITSIKKKSESSEDVSFGVPVIQGLVLLFKIPQYLAPMEKGMILEDLIIILLDSTQERGIHDEALAALEQISAGEPQIFLEIVLPNLIGKLPDKLSLDTERRKLEMTLATSYLQDLLQITCASPCEKELDGEMPTGATTGFLYRNFDAMQNQLLMKLDVVLQHEGHQDYVATILAAMWSGLDSFDATIMKAKANGIVDRCTDPKTGPYTYLVTALFQRIVQPKVHTGDAHAEYNLGYTGPASLRGNLGDTIVQLVGQIAMLALRSPSTTPENNFLLGWNDAHLNEPSAVWSLFSKSIRQDTLVASQPQLQIGPLDKCQANILSMYLVAGTRREDKKKLRIDIGNTAAVMIRNSVCAKLSNSKLGRMSMIWFLQLLVNKFSATKELVGSGEITLVEVMSQFVEDSASKSDEEVNNIYQTIAYFAAAALAAFDPSMTVLVKLMLDGISNRKHGRKIAQSFRILLAPSEILSKENFCILRPLRKARLYGLAVSSLVDMWRHSKEKETKDNALVALSGILAYIEPEMLKDNASEIIPLILEGTNVQGDDFAKASAVNNILRLVPLCPSVIEEHLDSVINRMTDRTHNTLSSPSDSPVRCRALALEVLRVLVEHIQPTLLLKQKFKLMGELDVALDDCSREVRHKAEQCKMQWFNLTETELN